MYVDETRVWWVGSGRATVVEEFALSFVLPAPCQLELVLIGRRTFQWS